MRYAHLDAGLVVNVIEADDEFVGLWTAAVALVPGAHAEPPLELVEGLDPEPGIGWTLVDGDWLPPADDGSAPEIDQVAVDAAAVLAQLADPEQPDPDVSDTVAALAVLVSRVPEVAALADRTREAP